MHNLWEEMLPFYIAGSLPQAEAIRLERHLEHCETCSTSLNEWKLVAAAVRAEAAGQMRALPPLAAEVLRTANERGHSRVYQTADLPRLVEKPRGAARTSAPMVALVAAFTVLVIGGVLALMVMTANRQNPNADSVVLLPSATLSETPLPITRAPTQPPTGLPQIIVIEPSITPIPPTATVPTIAAPTSLPPPTQMPIESAPTRMTEAQTMPTFVPPPSATPFVEQAFAMSMSSADCTAQAMIPSGSVINLYARPRTDANVLATISGADALVALAMSDNSWYQVQSAQGNVGWVQQSLVSASGSCDSLPTIPAGEATDAKATPTETVLPFPTLGPTTQTDTSSVPSTEMVEVM